jgi:hypothetical protein
MATDNLLSRFLPDSQKAKTSPSAAAPQEPPPPWLFAPEGNDRQAYEPYIPFESALRATSVEVSCHRSRLSYFFDYALITVPILTHAGDRLYFTAPGYAVTAKGRCLRPVMMALRLHACALIQDFSDKLFIRPEPIDPKATFIESLSVEILHGRREPKPE